MSPRTVVVLALVLSSCSAPPSGRQDTPPPAQPQAAAVPAPVPVPPPPRPLELVGMSREDAGAALGRPATVADQAGAIRWGYRAGPCSLSLLFYPEVGGDTWRVATYEVQGASEAACLSRLRDAHGRRR